MRRAHSKIGLPQVAVKPEPIIMAGGLDVMTPPFQLKPGACRAAQNFECSIFGGYRRIGGYERLSGKAAPSDATYTILRVSAVTGGAVGNTLHGATSSATGKIIAITSTYFVFTTGTGTFTSGENLNVGAGTIAVAAAAPIIGGASTPKLNAQYKSLAANVYRALIAAVPGVGRILGVVYYNDVCYAFRNAVGAATAALYKSSVSGWTLVALGRELTFTSGGTYQIAEGDTITGATSAATAVVKRVVLQSGSWAGGTAAGRIIFASQTGVFTAENLDVGTNSNVATIAANSTAITLQPSGRYEFVLANFTGSTDTKRIYGCDGVNRAFEFDGTVFVPIATGMTIDAPTHIAFHLYHLFLSFFGSVQHSSTGFPYQWTPVTGAAELAMGDNITGFQSLPAGATDASLAVFTVGRVSVLYGTGASDWKLLPYKDEIGAFAYTVQMLTNPMFLDLQGITDLQTAIQFGNFVTGALSNSVRTLLNGWRNGVVSSSLSRDLSQYRLFFTSGYGLYMSMVGKKVVGTMPVFFPDVVRCAFTGKTTAGNEISFFGTDSGYVMQFDKGTSFDGVSIEAYVNLAYNFSHGARTIKRYRHAVLELLGNGYGEFNFGYSLSYGSPNVIQPPDQAVVSNFSTVTWDAFTWDAFTWDGVTVGPSSVDIDGEAENISFGVRSVGDYFEPFTISGGVMHYSPRREMR